MGNFSFKVDSKVTLVQHAPMRVIFGLCREVQGKMSEFERKGILVKETETAEWISSMVVVTKPGKIGM